MTLEDHPEIILREAPSTDGTAAEVSRRMERHPHRDLKLVEDPRIGKADNVWTGGGKRGHFYCRTFCTTIVWNMPMWLLRGRVKRSNWRTQR